MTNQKFLVSIHSSSLKTWDSISPSSASSYCSLHDNYFLILITYLLRPQQTLRAIFCLSLSTRNMLKASHVASMTKGVVTVASTSCQKDIAFTFINSLMLNNKPVLTIVTHRDLQDLPAGLQLLLFAVQTELQHFAFQVRLLHTHRAVLLAVVSKVTAKSREMPGW